MKRIWVAVAFLSIAVGLCITGTILLHASSQKICRLLEECKTLSDTQEAVGALEKAEEIQHTWEKNFLPYYIFIRHGELDTLEQGIDLLPTLAKDKNWPAYSIWVQKCLHELDRIDDLDHPNFRNIF